MYGSQINQIDSHIYIKRTSLAGWQARPASKPGGSIRLVGPVTPVGSVMLAGPIRPAGPVWSVRLAGSVRPAGR